MSLNGTARELMVPLVNYPHVRGDATLRDVFAKMMASSGASELFRNILVLDEKDRLLGMLGLKDMLSALMPDYLKATSHFQGTGEDLSSLAALWQDDACEACHSAHKIIAGNHVTPAPTAIKADEPLTKALFLFATLGANILPVQDGKQLIGVLRLVDLLDEVSSEVLSEQVAP